MSRIREFENYFLGRTRIDRMTRIERIFFLSPAEIKEMKEIFVATRPQISQMGTNRTDYLSPAEIAEIAEIFIANTNTDYADWDRLHRLSFVNRFHHACFERDMHQLL